MDPEAYRAESRERWEGAAPGWAKRRGAFQQAAQRVSVWLVEHVHPQPGHRVLELAAGVGDTGLLAAELVQPGGSVIVTDMAEAMVEAARARAAELGIANAEFRTMEAEWIDLPAASVDGVLCRWGYMLLADPAAALRETRRVLKPGGRVALAAWAAAGDNPWLSAINEEVLARGIGERPAPGTPGPFALGEPGRIEGLLDAAGFEDPVIEALDFTFAFPSTDAHFEHQLDMSTRLREQLAALSRAEHYELRAAIDARLAEHVRPDGSVELPARTWVAAAGA
jgi:SAM-dependent methyltransferase